MITERIEYSEKQKNFHLVSSNHPSPPEKNSYGYACIAENVEPYLANAFCSVIENNFLDKGIKISTKKVEQEFVMFINYLTAAKVFNK